MSDPKLEKMARDFIGGQPYCGESPTHDYPCGCADVEILLDRLEQARREGAEEAHEENRKKLVVGFYEEGTPVYSTGWESEIQSPVTAEECNGLVARVKELEASLRDMRGSRDANSEALLQVSRENAELEAKLAEAQTESRCPLCEAAVTHDPETCTLTPLRACLAAERAAHEKTRGALREIRGRALAARTHEVRPLEARARFDAIATTSAAALRDEPEEPTP